MRRRNLAYWAGLSAKWAAAPPLAPCEEDLRWYQRQVDRLGDRPLRVLLFGATPGLARLAWPAGTSLAALDWSEGMLRNVFPAGHGAPVRADWRELPIAERSCDLVIGDGCYTAAGDEQSARLMNAEMFRVLRPAGIACFRCFVRPPDAPGSDALLKELYESREVFDLFRWRFAVAVQGARWGVPLAEVWRAWKDHDPESTALAARQGWTATDLHRIERWQNEPTQYAFPALSQLQDLALRHFEVLETWIPAYERAEYFPGLVLRRRATGDG